LTAIRSDYPDYYARPVPAFGVDNPGLLIVGLAPGLHGANASGRPFTGDYAGILLYKTLYKYGFSNRPESIDINDGLELKNCRITNAVKCLPPQNKPIGEEIKTCNDYLKSEIASIPGELVILALGVIAHGAVLKALALKAKDHPFGHGKNYRLTENLCLLDTYHCSRYNTNTKRLTEEMFYKIFDKVHKLLNLS